MRHIFLCSILLLLCACADPALTQQDNYVLQRMRNSAEVDEKQKSHIIYRLVHGNPEQLAEQAASKGDFRLISLTMGYMADKRSASVFAVECSKPVETQSVVFGCVPPPSIIFKLMLRYNEALVQHPNFPQKENCKMDDRDYELIETLATGEENAIKRKAEKSTKKWEEKIQKSKSYNN
jgi:hypothetical protein